MSSRTPLRLESNVVACSGVPFADGAHQSRREGGTNQADAEIGLPRAVRVQRWDLARWFLPRVVIGAAVVFSVFLSALTVATWAPLPFDWAIFTEAATRFWAGGLYETDATYAYRYSPLLAPALAALGWMGPIAWRGLHLVAALALPSWRLRLVVLASWPFWFDTSTGNTVIFVALAAAWALRGSSAGTASFLVLTLLIPRPLMLPIAASLLWRRPEWRVPFAAAFVVHAVLVLLTGWGDEWIGILLSSTAESGSGLNLAPSRWVGSWWLAIALPAAAWLTVRGHLGWASLMAAPYWLPYYLVMPLLEIDRRAWGVGRTPAGRADERPPAEDPRRVPDS